jgi:hypothetical protein
LTATTCCCCCSVQIGQAINGGQAAAGSNNAGADSSSSGTAVANSAECSYVKKRIGFRTVELVTDPLDKAVKVSRSSLCRHVLTLCSVWVAHPVHDGDLTHM